ncbi:MAG: DUF305 domain-containing protein [Acidimicrobiia bacterium]
MSDDPTPPLPSDHGDRLERGPLRMLTMMQVIALVVVVAVLSVGLTLWFTDDDSESFNEVDIGFLADMTTHHQGAISLAFDYLPVEGDDVVGHIAREVVTHQSVEIATMNEQLSRAGADDDPVLTDGVAMEWMGDPVSPADMPGMPSGADVAELEAATGTAADDLFSRLMIEHHVAGAAMADYEAEHGENDTVRAFAKNIAAAQRNEIADLNARRERLGLAPIDAAGSSGHDAHG